jgi:hypothetical protein
VTLAIANCNHVAGDHTNRLLSTILIVALGCLFGIVAIGLSYMPKGTFLRTSQVSGPILKNVVDN